MSARSVHERLRDRYAQDASAHDALAVRISVLRLILFSVSVGLTGVGLSRGLRVYLVGSAITFALFLVAVLVHARVEARRDRANTRRRIHEKHLLRIGGQTAGELHGGDLLPSDHPYAVDLDVVGPHSLFERIAVTHTRHGAETLARWLGAQADRETVLARQAAVRELANDVETRQELEAAVLDTGQSFLDPRGFLELAQREPYVLARPWLRILSIVLPMATLVAASLSGHLLPAGTWIVPLAAQGLIVWKTDSAVGERYLLLSSRRNFVEPFSNLLGVVENARWTTPALCALQHRLRLDERRASRWMRRLEIWAGLFDLRTQGIVHVVVNLLVFWDLHCLAGVERWMARAGACCPRWLEALGDVEALASLATLLHQDPGMILPDIAEPGSPLVAEGIAHPLIAPDLRVRNDLVLEGPGRAIIVTGSNMAGKSTLLRALGLNVALALAGGPVCATRFSVPPVRLRASIRVSDSLQSGASYFQAELLRLRAVIARAEESPPILFLLDEILRGTHARARHEGARAVVRHLLARGAMGVVATHDVALSELENELPGRVRNVHFTDVIHHGEMTFDYRLRPGVVRTSNALRLLRQAGIEVEDDEGARVEDDEGARVEDDEGARVEDTPASASQERPNATGD